MTPESLKEKGIGGSVSSGQMDIARKASITPIHKWGATACLHAAAMDISNDEKVLVLTYNKDGAIQTWSANTTNQDAMWLLECAKVKVLEGSL